MAQSDTQTMTEAERYGLALMRLWIAQNRLADGWYVNRRDEEEEHQEALAHYRMVAAQTSWLWIAYVKRGLQVRVTTDGRVLTGSKETLSVHPPPREA